MVLSRNFNHRVERLLQSKRQISTRKISELNSLFCGLKTPKPSLPLFTPRKEEFFLSRRESLGSKNSSSALTLGRKSSLLKVPVKQQRVSYSQLLRNTRAMNTGLLPSNIKKDTAKNPVFTTLMGMIA